MSTWINPAPVPSGPRCPCGNILTIEDTGPRCRQCILAGAGTALNVGKPLTDVLGRTPSQLWAEANDLRRRAEDHADAGAHNWARVLRETASELDKTRRVLEGAA